MPLCSTCSKEKESNCFYERSPGVHRKDCKECVKERSKKSVGNRIDAVKEYKKRWRAENREDLLAADRERYANRPLEYNSWSNMKARCHNTNHTSYADYGAKGVCVCERWNEFENFYADMGPRPTPGHSLDRIDAYGNYEPGNCRWSTNAEQQLNKKTTRYMTVGGIKKPVKNWSKELGIGYKTITKRLDAGWTDEEAASTPVDERFSRTKHSSKKETIHA